MTNEELIEVKTTLSKILKASSSYYSYLKYYPIKEDELEFFNTLKELKLVKFEQEDSSEYFKEIFDKFYISSDAVNNSVYRDFLLILFGFPKTIYQDDELKEIRLKPLFTKFKINNSQIDHLAYHNNQNFAVGQARRYTKHQIDRTLKLGFLYLNTLESPTKETVQHLIKRYSFAKTDYHNGINYDLSKDNQDSKI